MISFKLTFHLLVYLLDLHTGNMTSNCIFIKFHSNQQNLDAPLESILMEFLPSVVVRKKSGVILKSITSRNCKLYQSSSKEFYHACCIKLESILIHITRSTLKSEVYSFGI